jgi:hypothetical protein
MDRFSAPFRQQRSTVAHGAFAARVIIACQVVRESVLENPPRKLLRIGAVVSEQRA